MATVFEAQWGGGNCPECGDPILKGDEVSYSGEDLVHDECNAHSFSSYNYLTDAQWDGDEE